MGRVLFRQPNGLYAVFSSGTDTWVAANLTREAYIEWRVRQAEREARQEAVSLLDDTDAGLTWQGRTFEEADALSASHGGEVLSGRSEDEQPPPVAPG